MYKHLYNLNLILDAGFILSVSIYSDNLRKTILIIWFKHGLSGINVRKVPREILKLRAKSEVFNLPRGT